MSRDREYLARGRFAARVRSTLFLLPAWFAPYKGLRVFFHRLRGVRIGEGVEIGYFCIIGHVHPETISIAAGAVVAARASLLDHDNSRYYSRGEEVRHGPVRIAARAFVGLGAVILPGVTVGEAAIVGANSVVRDDVAPGAVVAGIPARSLPGTE